MGFILTVAALVVVGFLALWVVALRRVVPPNDVHIVQSRKKTLSYGKGKDNGNVYYEWPSWLPMIGVVVTILPVSIIKLKLEGYEAYDKDKVSFKVDVVAFFRIIDTNLAAERAENYEDMVSQLRETMEGAVRTVLASHDVETIMVDRSTFGEQFTGEIEDQLKTGWGVEAVKNMELMDIQNGSDSTVITDIQAKKQSAIQRDSLIEVANNNRDAKVAQIDAKKEEDLRDQQAIQEVGERTALQTQAVGVADEQALQEIKAQQKITTEKQMEVVRVEEVKKQEILKDQQVVKAQEDKETTILRAEGDRNAEQLRGEGIIAVGAAEAEARSKMEVAEIAGDIELAQEIGDNEGYQTYLISMRTVAANEKIGIEQAQALTAADVKIISNAGEPVEGATKVMDLFGPKGGNSVGQMMETLMQHPMARTIAEQAGINLPTEEAKDANPKGIVEKPKPKKKPAQPLQAKTVEKKGPIAQVLDKALDGDTDDGFEHFDSGFDDI